MSRKPSFQAHSVKPGPVPGHLIDPIIFDDVVTDEKRGELWMMDDPISAEDIDKYCTEWLDKCWSFYCKAEQRRAAAVEARLEKESLDAE